MRPASLQDGVAVLTLLEDVGYYPEPVAFANTFRRTIHDPHFLVRVAEAQDGRVVGVATLALRYQLGLGGLIASLDELAIAPGAPRGVDAGCGERRSARRARSARSACSSRRTSTRLRRGRLRSGRGPPRSSPPRCRRRA